jgi:hypothetical protein
MIRKKVDLLLLWCRRWDGRVKFLLPFLDKYNARENEQGLAVKSPSADFTYFSGES